MYSHFRTFASDELAKEELLYRNDLSRTMIFEKQKIKHNISFNADFWNIAARFKTLIR